MKHDVTATRETILQSVDAVEGVLNNPRPAVVIKAIRVADAELVVHAWIADAEQERPVTSRILEAAKTALDRQSAAAASQPTAP